MKDPSTPPDPSNSVQLSDLDDRARRDDHSLDQEDQDEKRLGQSKASRSLLRVKFFRLKNLLRFPRISRTRIARIPEWRRSTNYTVRPILMIVRLFFSLILVPACLSSALVMASVQCGAGFGEAIDLLGQSTRIVWSTLQANYGTMKIGAKVVLGLDGAPEGAELTAYILEASAKADNASAAIKNALAASMTHALATPPEEKEGASGVLKERVSLQSVITAAIIGAILPIFFFFLIHLILSRIWLKSRAHETLVMYHHLDLEKAEG